LGDVLDERGARRTATGIRVNMREAEGAGGTGKRAGGCAFGAGALAARLITEEALEGEARDPRWGAITTPRSNIQCVATETSNHNFDAQTTSKGSAGKPGAGGLWHPNVKRKMLSETPG